MLRERAGLLGAIAALRPLAEGDGPAADPALVGLAVAAAALLREESRGGHCRSDFPDRAPGKARRRTLRLSEIERVARREPSDRLALAAGG
jgi:L-aspartate oxidase